MSKLSIIILTYNSQKDIDACLQSVFSCNDLGHELEVILVDNNSSDQVALQDKIEANYPLVRYIQNIVNNGYGAGNNRGIAAASSPYILIMNPDVRLREFSFHKIVKGFDQHSSWGLQGFKQYETKHQRGLSFVMLKPCLSSFVLQKYTISSTGTVLVYFAFMVHVLRCVSRVLSK